MKKSQKFLPISKWPYYNNKVISETSKILRSGNVNYLSGNYGKNFEKSFSKYFKIKYSVAVVNATIGLELAIQSLGLNKDDEIIVTPRSYNSSATCIERVGLKTIFADIDPITMNIDPESIKQKISSKTKAIICVHLYGMPCAMQKINKIAKLNNIKVIEDCSQAHGSRINDRYVGSFGDIAVWSFCQDKIISTGGEGGMISTNKKDIYNNLWSLKEIGKNKNKYARINPRSNFFPWVHDTIGTNARLTEIQSSIGIYQLKELKNYIKIRNENAKIFIKYLKKCKSLIIPSIPHNIVHAFYRFTIIIKSEIYDANILMKILKKYKIKCNVGGCPVLYKEKHFINKYKNLNLTNAENLENKTVSFILDQTISKKDIIYISKTISMVIKKIEENYYSKNSYKVIKN